MVIRYGGNGSSVAHGDHLGGTKNFEGIAGDFEGVETWIVPRPPRQY
jgi:hypothetical protein